jgi:hypothetical protein
MTNERNPFERTALYLHDPFVMSLYTASDQAFGAVRPNGSFFAHAKHLYPSVTKLLAFRPKVNAVEATIRLNALPEAVGAFSDFEDAYEEMAEVYEQLLSKTRAITKRTQLAAKVRWCPQELEWLRLLRANITDAHIALQAHFCTLAGFVPNDMPSSDRVAREVFEPLYRLRNEYFIRPKATHLLEYLELSKELQTDQGYRDAVQRCVAPDEIPVRERSLNELEVQVEVAAMMKELM